MVFVPKVSVSVSLSGLIEMNIPVFHRGQREWESTEQREASQPASAPGESYPCEPQEHGAEGRLDSLLQLSSQVLCLWILSISSQNIAKFTCNLVNIHNYYYIWFLSIHKCLKVTQGKNISNLQTPCYEIILRCLFISVTVLWRRKDKYHWKQERTVKKIWTRAR